MNIISKNIIFLLVFLTVMKCGFAQDSAKMEKTGEIVMTKSELQSFLNKISELKKNHIDLQNKAKEKRKASLQELHKTDAQKDEQTGYMRANPQWRADRRDEYYAPAQQYNSIGEQRLDRELNLINARLDAIMDDMDLLKISMQLNEQPGSSSIVPIGKSGKQSRRNVVTPRQPIIIQQDAPPQIYSNRGFLENTGADKRNQRNDQLLYREQPDGSLLSIRQDEQAALKKKINGLENEIGLLQGLLKGSGDDEKNKYSEDINNLTKQMDALITQLNQNIPETDSVEVKSQNSILSDFSYNIYFENNSSKIPSSDYSKLQNIVRIAKQHPQAPVVLRGFASKLGDPQYNNKLSFERAASIKKWLLENGLSLKDIITMSHGEDKSVDASRARRVEITFKVQ